MKTLITNGIDVDLSHGGAVKYLVIPGFVIGAVTGACEHEGPDAWKGTAKGALFGAAAGGVVAALLAAGGRQGLFRAGPRLR